MQLYMDEDNEPDDKTDTNTVDNSTTLLSSYEMALQDDLPNFEVASKPLRAISKKRKLDTKTNYNDNDSLYAKSVMNTSASEFTPDENFMIASQTSREWQDMIASQTSREWQESFDKRLANTKDASNNKDDDKDHVTDEDNSSDDDSEKITCDCGDLNCTLSGYKENVTLTHCSNCSSESIIFGNCDSKLCKKCFNSNKSSSNSRAKRSRPSLKYSK
jgi:hypothetical protein